MTKVLITFLSLGGAREQLALACGVGAVEARGSIRLRRLPDEGGSTQLAGNPDALERMRREYVAPTEADVAWADAIVFCGPGGSDQAWRTFLDLLTRLASEGALDGKVGVVIGTRPDARAKLSKGDVKSDSVWAGILAGLGLVGVPAGVGLLAGADSTNEVVEARTTGRRAVAVARALAQGSTTRREAAGLF